MDTYKNFQHNTRTNVARSNSTYQKLVSVKSIAKIYLSERSKRNLPFNWSLVYDGYCLLMISFTFN